MAIKSPSTYGDYYWAMHVEAQKLIAEDTEKELSAMASRLIGSLGIRDYLPPQFASLFSDIESPAGAFLGDIGGRFVSEVADGAVSKAANPFFESMGYLSYMKMPTKKITPDATATLFSRKKIAPEFFLERFRMGGFEPIEAKFQFDSMRPYPPIGDLILYSRYHGDPDNVWSTMLDLYDVDPVDFKVWDWLGRQRLSTDQIQVLFKRGVLGESDFSRELAQAGWSDDKRPLMGELTYTLPNAMLLVQGGLHRSQRTEDMLRDISRADIHPDYAQTYLDAILTKPASMDLISYELRRDPDLSDIDRRLARVGIHPDYFDVYKTLAYPIPPVADIITMAVREAFTPAIAQRFGQYEDFPADFEYWARRKGLTSEWAKRYWASHWALPSATQGFSMLHRGIINDDELAMLLRAQDVMPFWRDKLIKVAYRPLTRVDVRRMYKEGVLDEKGVYEAYLDHGYNPDNARAMTEFTVTYVLGQLTKFTSKDVITAYTKRMITSSEARSMLSDLGVRSEDLSYIISTADYKREWELTDMKISGLRNLYKRKVNDENITRGELLKLDLPTEQVDVLMEQWYYEIKDEPTRTWTTAQTLGFVKDGLITYQRGQSELSQMGYDSEHIAILFGSIESIPKTE